MGRGFLFAKKEIWTNLQPLCIFISALKLRISRNAL